MELLVVTSVVGLLMSLMVPSFRKAREDARRTVCLANLKSIGIAMYAYASDNRDRGPQVMPRMGTKAPRSLLSRSGKLVNLGLLWPTTMPNSKAFICPSQTKFDYRPLTDERELNAYSIAGSYAYAVHLPAEESPRYGAIRHLAMVADDFTTRTHSQPGIGKFSHRVGYNVLYTDGSATWYSDANESIWARAVEWDDETDDISYQTLYDPDAPVDDGTYGDALDIFRVWHAMCYSRDDTYPLPEDSAVEEDVVAP